MMKRILFATLFAGLTAFSANAQQTLPSGTEIKVRTDTSIPAKPAADSRYSASVSDDVVREGGDAGETGVPGVGLGEIPARRGAEGTAEHGDKRAGAVVARRQGD